MSETANARRTRNPLRAIFMALAALVAVLVIGLIAFLVVIQARNSQYTDFTRFSNTEEVTTYLMQAVPLDSTTSLGLYQFLTDAKISHCYAFDQPGQPLTTVRENDSIRCDVLAPSGNPPNSWLDGLVERITLWNYAIFFDLADGKLSQINVRLDSTSS